VVDLQKSIAIRAPVEEVFARWTDFAHFPRFMKHVRDVRLTGDGRSHWVVEGPAGTNVKWDAELTHVEPNRLLVWRSLPGARVANAGVVRFESDGSGVTRVHVQLTFRPPGGALGHLIAALFGQDPKHALDDDLLRFKSLLEHGKASGRAGQVRADELDRTR
jgi:uncharacterized membrane protein